MGLKTFSAAAVPAVEMEEDNFGTIDEVVDEAEVGGEVTCLLLDPMGTPVNSLRGGLYGLGGACC